VFIVELKLLLVLSIRSNGGDPSDFATLPGGMGSMVGILGQSLVFRFLVICMDSARQRGRTVSDVARFWFITF